MRKLIVLLVLVAVMALSLNAFADEARTITRKTIVVTGDTVVSTQGVTVYKIMGYANASNSIFGLYNASNEGGAIEVNCKVEGAEATQYDMIGPITFENGLEFPNGLVFISGAATSAYLTIEYE